MLAYRNLEHIEKGRVYEGAKVKTVFGFMFKNLAHTNVNMHALHPHTHTHTLKRSQKYVEYVHLSTS